MLWGWERADHPAQLHYAWDLKQASSINEAINNLVRQAVKHLEVDDLSRPRIFEPGCGIGGVSSLMARERPNYIIDGISLVTSQITLPEREPTT
jgi:2-polyprenyl-3-methyl-5-hydroxy-6-metoxy-1,4-benzoquinol methylase